MQPVVRFLISNNLTSSFESVATQQRSLTLQCLFKRESTECSYCPLTLFWHFVLPQSSGLIEPLSNQNWRSSQSSSSGLIVRRTIRIDIPVDLFPSVCFWTTAPRVNYEVCLGCTITKFSLAFHCSTISLVASLVLEGTLLSELKQVLTAVFWLEDMEASKIQQRF